MGNFRKFRPAVVEEVLNDKVRVILNKKEIKSICAEKGCTICTHDFPQTEMVLDNKKFKLQKGDSIVVSMIVLNEAVGAFIAFIIPLIISILFFNIATHLLHWHGNEGKTVGGTLLTLLLSLWGLSAIDKIIRLISPPQISYVEKKE